MGRKIHGTDLTHKANEKQIYKTCKNKENLHRLTNIKL